MKNTRNVIESYCRIRLLDMQAIMKDAQAKNITDAIKMDETITSDKTGYAYFNDLFVKTS